MVRRAAWAWLLLAALCARVAAADGGEGKLTLAAPDHLLLGEPHDVRVRYRAPAALHAQLYVSTGRLGTAVRLPDGSFEVPYTPPEQRYPQVAILALVGEDGAQYAWTRIALYGSAKVELHSDKHVKVRVKVGNAEYGPVETGSDGSARVAVLVPPGIDHAISTAVDALGNERTESIPLDVPAIAPLLSVCAPQDARDFLVFSASADGKAATVPLRAEASGVLVSGTTAADEGVSRVAFEIPDAMRVGDVARLTVVPGEQRAAAVSCELSVPLERPERIELELSATSHRAESRAPISVKIVPHYRGVRERAAMALELAVNIGTLSQTHVVARESVAVSWALPQSFAGTTEAVLRASGDASERRTLALLAGPPKQLRATLAAQRLTADGYSSTRLVVDVRDAYGNPAHAARLAGDARGELSALEEVAHGRYEADYRAPRGFAGSDRVLVRDAIDGLGAEASLELVSGHGPIALGARAGYLTNFARVSGPLLVLALSYRLPVWQEHVRLSALTGFYTSQTNVPTDGAADKLDVGLRAVPLMLRVEYAFRFGVVQLSPLVGAGVLSALSLLSSPATGAYRDHSFLPLMAAGANAGLALGPGQVSLELSYWAAALDAQTVSGNAGGANVSMGYELPL